MTTRHSESCFVFRAPLPEPMALSRFASAVAFLKTRLLLLKLPAMTSDERFLNTYLFDISTKFT